MPKETIDFRTATGKKIRDIFREALMRAELNELEASVITDRRELLIPRLAELLKEFSKPLSRFQETQKKKSTPVREQPSPAQIALTDTDKKDVLLIVDWENVKKNIKTGFQADWTALIEICAKKGDLDGNKTIFTPMYIDYQLEKIAESNGFDISWTPAIKSKSGSDQSMTDLNMMWITRNRIEKNRRVKFLYIVSDDRHFAKLINYALDRGIKVIVVEVKNVHSAIRQISRVKIIKLPMKKIDLELPHSVR